MSNNYSGYLRSRWDERIWKELYGKFYRDGGYSDEQLAIISQRMGLREMPVLRTQGEKWDFLLNLEEEYWGKKFGRVKRKS